MTKRLKKFLSFIGIIAVLTAFVSGLTEQPRISYGATNDPTLRQEINILDSHLYAPSGSYATSSEIINIDTSKYSGATYYFEVVASTTSATNSTFTLRNATSSAILSSITVNGTSYTRYRSTSFTPSSMATDYVITIGNEATGKGAIAGRVVILQTGTSLTATQTQIEIGSATTTANNTTTLPLKDPKYWYYDSSVWDASPTFYAEVTYKTSDLVASSTLYNVSATSTATYYTYIVSSTTDYMVAEAWGAGGGGGVITNAGGGGGGGGGYARSTTSPTVGSSYILGVGAGGAIDTSGTAAAASSTVRNSGGIFVQGAGGGGTNGNGAGAASSGSTGQFTREGGAGGTGETTLDLGGGGGGSGGPDGAGVAGSNATATLPGNGGAGDNGSGGAGGARGSTNTDTCSTSDGKAGVNNVLGAGGGGGAGSDGTGVCTGGNGGRPGGGGGGSDGGASNQQGGPGQVKITEWGGYIGIALEEDDGSFGSWTFKQMIVTQGVATTSTRTRSSAFTPTTGRNYRLVASTTQGAFTYNIYNAKIVVQQGSFTTIETATYYFDASVSGPTDAQSVWTNDINAFDGSIVTFAQSVTPSVDATTRFLVSSGTTAPSSNTYTINSVVYSAYSSQTSSGGQYSTNINIKSGGSSLTGGNKVIALDSYGPSWLATTTLSVPSGGWTWTKISQLEVVFFPFVGLAATFTSANLYRVQIEVNYTVTTVNIVTLTQPQYLLANKTLSSGTSLQDYDTLYDPAEWDDGSNGSTLFYHEASSQSGGTSDVKLQDTSGPTDITGSTITDIIERERTSNMTMPGASATLDVIATTNNNDIYSSRIIVNWAYSNTGGGGGTTIYPDIIWFNEE